MNRNIITKCVPPINLDNGQANHHQQQQSSLTSTTSSCGSSTNTTNSLNSHTSSSCGSGSSPLDNLPKKFVSSMRTLFDIMDDKRTGFVRLVDIEARWQDDGSKGLPHGVIDCLRRVTPVSGMLSFERFCAGLKICLLRNQTNDCKTSRRSSTDSNSNLLTTVNNNNINNNNNGNGINGNINGNGKMPTLNNNNNNSGSNNVNSNGGSIYIKNSNNNHFTKNAHISEDKKIARTYKRSSLPVQRTLSLPKLSPSSDGESPSSSSDPIIPIIPSLYAPPKPPRTGLLMTNGSSTNNMHHLDRFDKAEIRTALQNWQMNVLMNEWGAKDKRRAMAPNTSQINRGNGDGSPNLSQFQQQSVQQPIQHSKQQPMKNSASMTHPSQSPPDQQKPQQPPPMIYPMNRSPTLLEFQKKSNRRRETRRHTLQNGIDYNMLKRIRHYEEEKDLLLDGLHAVEKAQEWYFKQIALVQEKMKCLGRGDTHLEQWSEAHQERLDLQRARIMEVNRYLASLANDDGFPLHMNLAVRNHHAQTYTNGNEFHGVQLNQLKLQNRQLTDEVSQKSERITALELERKSLYRELLQHQQQQQQLQQQLLRKQGHILCGNEEVIF